MLTVLREGSASLLRPMPQKKSAQSHKKAAGIRHLFGRRVTGVWETRHLHSDLESIYRLHRAGLFAVALTITRSSSDAEDAVHDAFARLCGRADMNGTDPVAYAYIAVRNAAIDRLRRRRGNEPLSISIQAALDRSAHGVADNERDRAIAASIDELEPEHRAPLLLRIFCGLTFRQISQIENAPLQTIASRYNAALERLRPKLKEWL